MIDYLDMPAAVEKIMEQKDIRRIDLKKSIHNMIHLITVTSYNEVKMIGYLAPKYDI